jgi:hypothetical protein
MVAVDNISEIWQIDGAVKGAISHFFSTGLRTESVDK